MKKKTTASGLKIGVAVFMLLFSGWVSAQNLKQTLSLRLDKVTLKEFFKEIESKTSFAFVYRDILIDNKNNVSINANNKELHDILKNVLSDKGLQAEYRGNTIIIKSKTSDSESTDKLRNVSGRVLDERGDAIVGAIVSVKNTAIATMTGYDGDFALELPSKALLTVSFVGYQTSEIATEGENHFNIVLKEENKLLNEVVVIGYGSIMKKDLTTAVSIVSGLTH